MGQRVKKPINEWGIVCKAKNKYQHFCPLKLLITWSCFNNDIPNWWQCFLPPSNIILLLCVLKGCQSHAKHGRKVKQRVQDTKECRAIKSWFSSSQKPHTDICSLILQAFPGSSSQCLCKHLREAKRLMCITGVPGDRSTAVSTCDSRAGHDQELIPWSTLLESRYNGKTFYYVILSLFPSLPPPTPPTTFIFLCLCVWVFVCCIQVVLQADILATCPESEHSCVAWWLLLKWERVTKPLGKLGFMF